MRCPNCDEEPMTEIAIKNSDTHYICETCGYAEAR